DDVLLAGAGHAFLDVQLVGDVQQLGRGHLLEVAQRVLRKAFRHLRVGPWNERLVAVVVARQAVAVAAATAAAAATTAVAVTVTAVAEALAAVVAAAVALVALLAAARVLGLVAGVVARGCLLRRCLCGRGAAGAGFGGCGSLGGLGARLAHALLGRGSGVGIRVGQA